MDLSLASEPKRQRLLDMVEQTTPPGSDEKIFPESEMDDEESPEKVSRPWLRLPLIEVFSVEILNHPGSDSHLYGTIAITAGGMRSQYIYNREKDESQSQSQSICPDNTVLLTGPKSCVVALDGVYLDVDLRYKDSVSVHYKSPDHHVIRVPWRLDYDTTLWNSYIDKEFNEILYLEIENNCFPIPVGVTFMVMKDGMQATVNVLLIIQDPKSTPKVSGSITAGNCNFSEKSVLFQKALPEHLDVMSGELIPLSRSAVAVPWNSDLIVEADLYDDISSRVIAKGTANFPLNLSSAKFFKKRICGQGSEIRVEVTWIGDL